MIVIRTEYGKKKSKEHEIHIVPNKFNHDYTEYFNAYKLVLELSAELQAAQTIEEIKVIESKIE